MLTCQILGLLVNTVAADDKYPVLNRENLTIPIKMQLSKKEKYFSELFAAFLKCSLNLQQLPQKQNIFCDYFAPFLISTLNFEYFQKEDDAHRFCISKNTGSENVVK